MDISRNKLVLVSGGLDSSTLLADVYEQFKEDKDIEIIAANIYYGQKHDKERQCAKIQSQKYCKPGNYVEINLPDTLMEFSDCPLLKGNDEVPEKSYEEQLNEMGGEGIVKTYVPFRNGILLSIAASLAIQHKCNTIYYGAHADDALGNAYPDCTEGFINFMGGAIIKGSDGSVALNAPFSKWNKAHIVARGIALNVDYSNTWSCYKGQDKPCGVCGTCIDRKAAFKANKIEDPLK